MKDFLIGASIGLGIPTFIFITLPWLMKFLDWYFPWVAAL